MKKRAITQPGGVVQKPGSIDWPQVHLELMRPRNSLKAVWRQIPNSHSYERFNFYYKRWRNSLNLMVRHTHQLGDELFVGHLDFSHLSFRVRCNKTGEVYPVSLIVAMLPASRYCFAKLCSDLNIVVWTEFHQCAFRFFEGAAQWLTVTPDTAVLSKHEHFQSLLAAHGIQVREACRGQVLPTLLLRWFNLVLKGKTFRSVSEANKELLVWIRKFNKRPFKKVHGSPHVWFSSFEKAYLIQSNNSISAGNNGSKKSERSKKSRWSINRVRRWAQSVGPATTHVVNSILDRAENEQRGAINCLGILSLETDVGSIRLEDACKQAIQQGNSSVKRIRKMVEEGNDVRCIQLTIPKLHVQPGKQAAGKRYRK